MAMWQDVDDVKHAQNAKTLSKQQIEYSKSWQKSERWSQSYKDYVQIYFQLFRPLVQVSKKPYYLKKLLLGPLHIISSNFKSETIWSACIKKVH